MSKLDNYCLNITDGEHGTVLDDNNGEFFLLSNKNIIDGKIIITDKDRKINKDTFEKINKRTVLKEGDVVIATVGTLGKTAVIKDKINYVFQRSVGIIKPKQEILNSYFLKYILDNPLMQKRIHLLSKGAVQKCLFISDLKNLDIDIPDIKKQKLIVKVLKNIDDKIENNNEINEELESMAKTIYDYWFLQFDFPDGNGKPYKSSGGKMVWNEKLKKEIPEGWEVKDILDLCEVVDCLHSKKPNYYYEDEKYYLLTLANLTQTGTINVTEKYYISKDDYEVWTSRIIAKENDFIVTNAGRAGDICKIPKNIECAIGRNITAIRPINIDPYYLRSFFKSNYIKEQILGNLDCGSFFMSFNVKSIKKLKILYPKKEIYNRFIEKVNPIVLKIEENEQQNQQLNSLRDFLLPLLMNGQVGFKGLNK